MEPTTFSAIFVTVLAATLLQRLWLDRRQIRWVKRHRDKVPPDFAHDLSLTEHQKAADYTVTRTRFGVVAVLWSTAILLAWTLGGGLQLLDDWWGARLSGPLLPGLAVVLSAGFIGTLVELPISAWEHFVIEERFGFNRMTGRLFFVDTLKELAVLLLLMSPLVAGVLWIMDTAGPNWWLAAWFIWMAFTLIVTWAYPRLIAPLFNRFEPLPGGDLRTRIEALLQRCGFSSRGLFVMDASRRSAHGNAYFSGFGRNKRIVLFDTLVKDLDDAEVESVLAHELGHFRLRHVPKRLMLMGLFGLLALRALAWLATQQWFYSGLGVDRPADHMALILFALIAPVFLFMLTPFSSWYSRRHEFEADAYAREKASAGALATALVSLYRENATTLTPDPVYSRFYHSHPPALERINRLRSSRPPPAHA